MIRRATPGEAVPADPATLGESKPVLRAGIADLLW
jgi:hypothetical protein